ncbi:hypothetical protein BDW72DRAFT_202614 [Aspergillus terricola var. indicus]
MPTVPVMDRSSGSSDAIVFTTFGAAYGAAKAGVGVCSSGVLRPDLIVKHIVLMVMAGILGIYGLVVFVLIANNFAQEVALYTSLLQLGAGLAVGLCGLAAGFAIGIVGDAGLYGLIVALLMNARAEIVDFKCI